MPMAERLDVERTPLEGSLTRLRTLVSRSTGIVREISTPLAAPDDARLFCAACELADTRPALGVALDANASASSDCRETALAAALGEAAERYSASYVPEHRLVLASAGELGHTAVSPERFALFHENQYREATIRAERFTSATRVRWVQGFSLPDGDPAWLPAQLVYLTALPPAPGEALIGFPTSSGLACGPTFAEAVLAGLLEVVERDAFMIIWHNRLSLPRLDISGHPELVAFHERYLEPAGLAYEVVDASVFHRVPTMFALVRGTRGDVVSLALGAASAVRAADAWRKAVAEAFLVRAWARSLRLAEPERAFAPPFADVRGFAEHVQLHALEAHAHRARFLDAANGTRPIDAIADLEGSRIKSFIEAIVGRIEAAGAGAYAVDVTSPDIRAAGLAVAKVVAPELCALDVAHDARLLGGSRLYSAAFELGLRGQPLAWGDLNPDPHPFP